MIAPNTLLQNRYLIVRPIGRGGMGAVYMARDQRLHSIVALKESFFGDERMRRAFEREAELLANLHHPALPNVIDHFTEGDGQFLVMQFIQGEDLGQMMEQKGSAFPPAEALPWADQLLEALDYLHTQEPPIIHRDIKPQNLKLTGRGQIILLDFGLAKGTAGQMASVGGSRSVLGFTPNFAPLEQIQGVGTDTRSDLYSLAATLYYLMTGVVPPDALSRGAAVLRGQPDPLRSASELNREVAAAVARVLESAMAQNPDQRPQTAEAMREALRDASPDAHGFQRRKAQDSKSDEHLEPTKFDTSLDSEPTEILPAAKDVVAERPETQAEARVSQPSHEPRADATLPAEPPPPPPVLSPTQKADAAHAPIPPEKPVASEPTLLVNNFQAAPAPGFSSEATPGEAARWHGGNLWLGIGAAAVVIIGLVVAASMGLFSRGKSAPPPALNSFSFDTVTVNAQGKVTERRIGQARSFNENVNGVMLEMVEIPGGTFTMGSPNTEPGRGSSEGPQHRVTVQKFYMGKFEVTQTQWRAVASLPKIDRDLNSDPSYFKGDTLPVEKVSWEDSVEFCKRLSRKTGREYRLPSEAEWEYASRAGTQTPFAFGETITTELASYNGDHPYGGAPKGVFREKAIAVGSLGVANGFGLYDMHGNLWEWCLDDWHENYNGAPGDGSAWLSGGDSTLRVLRGGSWSSAAVVLRSADRFSLAPDSRDDAFGFRVVAVARSS